MGRKRGAFCIVRHALPKVVIKSRCNGIEIIVAKITHT